jgi:hypothetical protein
MKVSMHCRAASPEHTCHLAACTSGPGRAAWGRHPPWVGAQSWGQRCSLSTVAHPPLTSAVHLQRHAKVCFSLLMYLDLAAEIVLSVTRMHTGCACVNCLHHNAYLALKNLHEGTFWGRKAHGRLLMTSLCPCLHNTVHAWTICDICPNVETPPGLSGLTHRCQKARPICKTRWNKSVGKQMLEDTRTYTCPSGRSSA